MSASKAARPRVVAVVTGSELVRGDRTDRNGPFFMKECLALGLEPARVMIVGDDVAELEAALRQGLQADLCLVSGGLGPTHDDRTVELVAKVVGAELIVDPQLEAQIGAISRGFAERLGRPVADFHAGVIKQATIPAGSTVLGVVGTAPGLVIEAGPAVVVVLPGPPRELQALWPLALESSPVQRVVQRSQRPHQQHLRFFGVSESRLAKALADAGGDGDGVEVTICAHDFELHVDIFIDQGSEERAARLREDFVTPVEEYLFTTSGEAVERLVLDGCRSRGLTLATAESCTGGMVAARLTEVPGASAVFRGSVVAYANEAKTQALGVDQGLLAEHGAVSAEVAAAMATGVRKRLGVDVAVSVTGIAGPDGGSPEKPVGLVFFHVSGPSGEFAHRLELPGDRATIRMRATTTALHLVRRALDASLTS